MCIFILGLFVSVQSLLEHKQWAMDLSLILKRQNSQISVFLSIDLKGQ